MAEFEAAIAVVLAHETGNKPDGGLVRDPDDPGGVTKWGISLALFGRFDPNATASEIAALTREQACAFYRAHFWDGDRGTSFGDIADQSVATKILDMAVNMGREEAIRAAQALFFDRQDGIFGPMTLQAINKADAEDLLHRLRVKQAVYSARKAVGRAIKKMADPVVKQTDDHAPAIEYAEKYLGGWMERALW